jgi:hypothetical protein
MQHIKAVIVLILGALVLSSCDSKLDVNAEWKDITVVYGVLDQNDSVHYLKITKAFLGPGDALSFAKIADSSNYAEKLDVTMEEWDMKKDNNGKIYDSQYMKTIRFDTSIITNKEEGDSIFYYPRQLVYKSEGIVKLNSNYFYKLFIKEPGTGKLITSQTPLVRKIGEIITPKPSPARASFIPGTKNHAEWTSAEGGKRYQLVARFYYIETKIADTSQRVTKYVDWIIFNNLKTDNTAGGIKMDFSYSSDVFYIVLGGHIPIDPSVTRVANKMEYIFTVAADDLNTYMEVTEPSYTIVQEKPPYTNISNGIGIFTARHDNTIDYPIIQTAFSQQTLDQLKVNPNTYLLGF